MYREGKSEWVLMLYPSGQTQLDDEDLGVKIPYGTWRLLYQQGVGGRNWGSRRRIYVM